MRGQSLYFNPILIKRIAAYKFTFLSACVILIALLVPGSTFQKVPVFFGIDKIAHFVLFFVFALSYVLEFKRYHGRLPAVLHALALIVLFVVISELLQLLTSSRHFEFADMAFDTAGALTAFIATRVVSRTKKKG